MKWLEALPENRRRGSRPRCVLFTDGGRDEVAARLTRLVNLPGVGVSPDDEWMPYGKPIYENGPWDDAPIKEAQLDKQNRLELSKNIRKNLQDWWLCCDKGKAITPNLDIAATCQIMGKPGLLLAEAKAHKKELSEQDKCGAKGKNYKQIGQAIAEANAGLKKLTGNSWNLCRDKHYQLSNRFAWAWKLASLGIPVVLIYLGFLNATDMKDDGELFHSGADWESALTKHSNCIVDNSCWGKSIDCNGAPLIPLIRVFDQPFNPCA